MPEELKEELEEPAEKLYYDQLSVARRTSQKIHFVNEHDKNALILHLIKNNKYTGVVVVTKTKRQADALSIYLQKNDIKALSLHSNKGDKDIKNAVDAFNKNEDTVLVMTDMSLQNQDFPIINHMISNNIPTEPKFYYERLVKLEEKGEGINLVSEEEYALMNLIEMAMKVEILEVVPVGFTPTPMPDQTEKPKKDKTKKPRHKKRKTKKDSKEKEAE
jgi:ATP-dependent RNA helicase RhlE